MDVIKNSESDRLIEKMRTTKQISKDEVDGKFIHVEIIRDLASIEKKRMEEGVKYYNEKHKILKADADMVDIDGARVKLKDKPNIKAVHDIHTLLVDQKRDYFVGNDLNIAVDNDKSGDKKKAILLALGENFQDNIKALVTGTSNKSVEWAHYFINEDGDFDWVITPAEQIIAYYDGLHDRKLIQILRYYTVEDLNVNTGARKYFKKAEVWTATEVSYWADSGNGKYEKDKNVPVNPRPHVILTDITKMEKGSTLTEDEVFSWGEPPFLPLYNNSAHKTDLQPIKSLIDLYDVLIAGGSNTIIEVQEAIWEVRGFEGETTAELVEELRKYKVVNLSAEENAGVSPHQLDIPHEARQDILDRTKKAIYEQGRGVNFGDENIGDAPSGIALKFLFANLDMKCNDIENSLYKLLKKLVGKLLEWKDDMKIEPIDVTYNVNKRIMINEVEHVEMIKNSVDLVSERTLLEEHPLVKDVDEELRRKKKERKERESASDFSTFNENDEEKDDEEE